MKSWVGVLQDESSFVVARLFFLALIFSAVSFLINGFNGLNIADEGFLWYGVQRTMEGEVPLRDFQSYDPGRYYWSAALALIFGKGLVALRFSEAVFQLLGIWAGLLAAARLCRTWMAQIAVGLALTVWMFPSHKLFDHTLLLVGLWLATRMLEKSTLKNVFIVGIYIGLCTFFGRNHALYQGLGSGALLFLLWIKQREEVPFSRFFILAGGMLVGVVPLLLMLVWVPGFSAGYWRSIEAIFVYGTNVALPIPWIWKAAYSPDFFLMLHKGILALLFTLLPVSYLAGIGACCCFTAQKIRANPLFAASAFLGLFYTHHAFSRADYSHLAQSIHPLLLGAVATVALLGGGYVARFGTLLTLFLAGLFGVSRLSPVYGRITAKPPWVPYEVDGTIYISQRMKALCDGLNQFVARNVSPEEAVLFAPYMPAMYPLLNLHAPLWDTYFFNSPPLARQKEMLATLVAKNVNWAVLSDTTIDQRADLRFSATHPLLWNTLISEFEPVIVPDIPSGYKILRRKKVSVPHKAQTE